MNEEIIERKLQNLFDFQRFAGNKRLGRVIDETRLKYNNVYVLSEDELSEVNAAGVTDELRGKRLDGDQNGRN